MRYHTIIYILISLILNSYLPSSTILTCNTPFECSGTISNTDWIFATGYKSITGTNTSVTITGIPTYLWCDGAFSCWNIGYMQIDGVIVCVGSNSCSNINDIYPYISTMGGADCYGSNSCIYSTIIGSSKQNHIVIHCSADQACSYSNIHHTTAIFGDGAYSLYNTYINSSSVTPYPLSIYLYGYQSGYGGTLICESGDTCFIYCNGNGCEMFYVHCMDGSICRYGLTSNNTILPINNTNDYNPIQLNLYYNSSVITLNNDQLCTNQTDTTIVFDDVNEHYYGSDIVVITDNGGPICCRGSQACRYTEIIKMNTTTNDSIICSGDLSCANMNILANTNGPIYCEGAESCVYNNNITTNNDVYCLGRYGCSSSNITAKSIYCGGRGSCQLTTIQTLGNDLNVYLLGYKSGNNANIYCNDGDNCLIVCGGKLSCDTTNVYCNGNCIIECDLELNDNGCPNIISSSPTAAPTELTSSPSYSPSHTPTGSTSFPSDSPSDSPTASTSFPTPSPTSAPISYPISSPTITNNINITPTNSPTEIPSYSPTITMSEAPSMRIIIIYFSFFLMFVQI